MARSRDTTPDAEAMQVEVLRRMTSGQKTRIGWEMSMAARATTLAAIRARHPEYDDAAARWALFRMLVGDDLFKRVWPAAPLLAP